MKWEADVIYTCGIILTVCSLVASIYWTYLLIWNSELFEKYGTTTKRTGFITREYLPYQIRAYGLMLLALFGYGFIFYWAAYGILWWLPNDWGSGSGEDFRSGRHSFSITIAVACIAIILGYLTQQRK